MWQFLLSKEVTEIATYQVTVSEEPVVPEHPDSETSENPDKPAKKKGCGGSIIAASILVPSLLGLGAFLLIKRKEK